MLREVLPRIPVTSTHSLHWAMPSYAKGDYEAAIARGTRRRNSIPGTNSVHTNLSKAYMKAGNKPVAEHHALQSRIASWRGEHGAAFPVLLPPRTNFRSTNPLHHRR